MALNPATPLDAIALRARRRRRMVLIMSVNPGFGGQSFIPQVLPKIRALRAEADRARPRRSTSRSTAASRSTTSTSSRAAGANVIVSGSGFSARRTTPTIERCAMRADRAAARAA